MAVAAVAVLVVVGVVGYAMAGRGGSHGRNTAATHHSGSRQPAGSIGGARRSPPTPAARAGSTVPPTSAPVSAVLVATSFGSSTYRVGASATITVWANHGPCWLEIRQSGPNGPVVFTGDIMAGSFRHLTDPVWVRLGNPGAITVNGASISPPGMAAGEPYNLQFA